MIYNKILDLVGDTPIVRLKSQEVEGGGEVYIKLEGKNLGGSIKDRAVLGMIEEAEKKGVLKKDSVIIEASSGNTGIATALMGGIKGYSVIVVMPDSMSIERRRIIKAYGAKLILTDGSLGMKGAIDKALELNNQLKNGIILSQFENLANPEKHYETTAREILEDLPNLNVFVAGVGTGGTISGVGKRLKEKNSNIKVVAVEPVTSAVISGEDSGKHKVQGIGAGFVPEILDLSIIDSVEKVEDDEVFQVVRSIALKEGLLLGISSGANILAASRIAKKLDSNKKVVTISPDNGEKYLSTELFN